MQTDNRGTIASLTPQIGLPRPSSNLGFAGERPVPRRPLAEPSSGRSPANPKLLDGLGKQICGVREAIVPLLSLCLPLLSFYYPLIIPLLSPYHPAAWSNLGSPCWLCKERALSLVSGV